MSPKFLVGNAAVVQGCVPVQAVQKAKRLRAIVAPRTNWDAGMGASKPFRRRHFDVQLVRNLERAVKLVWDSERITHQETVFDAHF